MKKFSVVVACTAGRFGIGIQNRIPWRLPGEMKYFVQITTSRKDPKKKNAVIMGRKTWDGIPEKHRPLKDRINVILTRNKEFKVDHEHVYVCHDLHSALELLSKKQDVENVFCIGGAEIYRQALLSSHLEYVYLTKIYKEFECDTFFPRLDPRLFERDELYNDGKIDVEGDVKYSKQLYKKRHEEYQYLDLIREVIQEGTYKMDRTGTGTVGKFGYQMRFNLRETFPLLTTKRVYWKGVVLELLWFIKGCTDANELTKQGCKIWQANGSREYLDSIGLKDREEGDLGPIYGFQWRHWGAEYKDFKTDYTNKGIDQLKECIHKIKNNPNDRRIIMTAWNPSDIPSMALPPCHMFCQFYVEKGELSCQMYQRSCDLGLGVPFNIASYSLLTCMIAQVCGLKPGDFIHVLGDAHIYKNHIEPLMEQLKREPKPFPKLVLNPNIQDIDQFTLNDIQLEGYHPHGTIKMEMSV